MPRCWSVNARGSARRVNRLGGPERGRRNRSRGGPRNQPAGMDDSIQSREPFDWIGIRQPADPEPGNFVRRFVRLSAASLRTHLYVIGSTGSGKTTLIHNLIFQDVARGHSVCVLDMRGDLVNAALRICAARLRPEQVALIDLREAKNPTGYNPLAGAGEPHFRALGVYSALEDMSESWGIQLGQDLRNALLLLAATGGSLDCVRRVLTDRKFLSDCLSRCEDDELADHWRRFDAVPDERREARVQPVLNKLSGVLATRTLRRMFSHHEPVDLGAHLDTPGSVTLVSLAADEMHDVGQMIGRMVLASVCRERFSKVCQRERSRNQVRLYADEFENFGYSEFEHILSEGRRFGLSCVLSHQTSSQISPRVLSLILGNCGAKIAFRCGREDAAMISRDLTGDPKALDLASQRPGEAHVWTRESGVVRVETNAPMFDDAAEMPEHALAFRRMVLECRGSSEPSAPQAASDDRAGERGHCGEDWLCG